MAVCEVVAEDIVSESVAWRCNCDVERDVFGGRLELGLESGIGGALYVVEACASCVPGMFIDWLR